MSVEIKVEWKGRSYTIDLESGKCIAIPLDHTKAQPNAWFAPLYDAFPHKSGDWIGDTREGAPVNFYDVRLNPHGNGTHTESVGHIAKERIPVHHSISNEWCVAQLISVYPTLQENGDKVIGEIETESGIEALIIRTLPNHNDKLSRQYGGTNPGYLDANFARKLRESGIRHLLIDLPSVDREEDQGVLEAHHEFWNYPANPRMNATISEMIFVDNDIQDGLYLLNIQIPAMMLDAAPSRPFIYPLI